jgi:hypothetical protein
MHAVVKRHIEKGDWAGVTAADVPSIRTIGDWMKRGRAETAPDLNEEVVSWPESFGDDGLFPWEASAAYFELVRLFDSERLAPLAGGRRPLYPLMRWYWRMTLAVPGLDPTRRWSVAAAFAIAEVLGTPRQRAETARRHETLMKFAPEWEALLLATGQGIYPSVPYLIGAPQVSDAARARETVRASELFFGAHSLDEREMFEALLQHYRERADGRGRPDEPQE